MLTRSSSNPILTPNPSNDWESVAVFNPSVVKVNNKYVMLYRAMGRRIQEKEKIINLSVIGRAESDDGINFSKREIFIKPEFFWEKYGCEDPRVIKIDNQYLIFYTALSNYPPDYTGIKTAVAFSSDLEKVEEKYLLTPFNAKAVVAFPEKINDQYYLLLTVNTDKPPTYIAWASFDNLRQILNKQYWLDWYENLENYILPLKRFDDDQIEIGAPPVKTKHGWLLVYSYIKHYLTKNIEKKFRVEAVLLDINDPKKIIGRVDNSLLIPEADYERKGQVNDVVFPTSSFLENNRLWVYYGAADTVCGLATTDISFLIKKIEINAPTTIKVKKFIHNPILEPIPEHSWEAKAVFNAGAIEIRGKIYLIYRALSNDNISRFGLAISEDGYFIDERLDYPIYPLRSVYEKPKQGGLGGGTEDPRLTIYNDQIYMCYTAYDGKLPRLAFSSITIDDFLKRNFNRWSDPKIISPLNIADKDGAMFPEKINDQFVFLHRIEPNIVIDFINDLNFKEKSFLEAKIVFVPHEKSWEEVKVGINGPPIKTDYGWLIFYHGISAIDRYYRIGAMLFDLKNPLKLISHTYYPILEPFYPFEKEGIVNNVVFSCGQVVKDDEIIIYYGGADKVLCGAKISLAKLIDYILKWQKRRYLNE